MLIVSVLSMHFVLIDDLRWLRPNFGRPLLLPVLCISSNRSTVLFAHKVKHGQETPLFPGIPIRDLSTPLDFYFPRKDPSFMAPELSLTIELSTTPASSDSIRSRAKRKTNPPRSKFERKINVEFLCCRRSSWELREMKWGSKWVLGKTPKRVVSQGDR